MVCLDTMPVRFQKNKAWPRDPAAPLFGCWCFQGVEERVVVTDGWGGWRVVCASGPIGIPSALARRPSCFGPGQILCCLCAPPYCLALLTGGFPGFPLPHIGMV